MSTKHHHIFYDKTICLVFRSIDELLMQFPVLYLKFPYFDRHQLMLYDQCYGNCQQTLTRRVGTIQIHKTLQNIFHLKN